MTAIPSHKLIKRRERFLKLKKVFTDIEQSIEKIEKLAEQKRERLSKINEVCKEISIDELKNQRDAKINLEKRIIELKSYYEKSFNELNRLKDSAKMLNLVPCGTSFPDCMFIKSSHDDKIKIESQLEGVKVSISNLESCQESLEIINQINPEEKIIKYDALFLKSKELESQIKISEERILNLNESKLRTSKKEAEETRTLQKMEIMMSSDQDDELVQIREKIDNILVKIERFEKTKVKTIGKIAEK